ncbi:hypothetical protein BV210_15040 [Halorientalis sp. IM1011]|uniref:hypothetical protein n=1 Tax=Halorientalis sp. IM1011 TaxID=1932360 RepID=UPI00097CC29E|nr:hypothetical protein [Halorientalis sp. IM1011]AQL43936.1 hypothetical protein BV210_15040 [Halorientalis sp. IM1011]
MRELTQRVLAGLLAIALVSSAVAPVGTAAAANGDDCEPIKAGMENNIGPMPNYYAMAGEVVSCLTDSSSVDQDKINENQAHQTHADLFTGYKGATAQHETLNTTFQNLGSGLKTVRRIEGKNAFIRSLNTSQSKAESITTAKRAVKDNYSASQVQLARSFESRARHLEDIASKADSEQNLSSEDIIRFDTTQGDPGGVAVVNVQDTTVTLVNGTSYQTEEIVLENSGGAGHTYDVTNEGQGSVSGGPLQSVDVVPPDQLDSETRLESFTGTYSSEWSELESQANTVASNVGDFANRTYDAWSAGVIDRSDLVDPYLGARNYEPDAADGSTWTLRSLTSLGISPPEDLNNIRAMQIRDGRTGTVHNGTLMSDAIPGDGFVVGQTYNSSKIAGPQYVVTESGDTVPLKNEFTLVSADGFEGANYSDGDTVKYTNPTSTRTTNLSEFAALSDKYQNLTVRLEARERKLENKSAGGTGGLFDFDGLGASLPFGGAGVVVAIGAIVTLGLVTRN